MKQSDLWFIVSQMWIAAVVTSDKFTPFAVFMAGATLVIFFISHRDGRRSTDTP